MVLNIGTVPIVGIVTGEIKVPSRLKLEIPGSMIKSMQVLFD